MKFGLRYASLGRYSNGARTRIQLAPANLHWCSDPALLAIKEHAVKYQDPALLVELVLVATPAWNLDDDLDQTRLHTRTVD